MKATATAPSNGATKDKTAQTAPAITVNAPGVKLEETTKDKTPAAPAPKPRTIAEELERIRHRSDLADKLDQLIGTKARLEQFRLTGTGMREKLTITDGVSQEWTTSNTAVIEAVYGVICSTVDVKISEIEAELLASA